MRPYAYLIYTTFNCFKFWILHTKSELNRRIFSRAYPKCTELTTIYSNRWVYCAGVWTKHLQIRLRNGNHYTNQSSVFLTDNNHFLKYLFYFEVFILKGDFSNFSLARILKIIKKKQYPPLPLLLYHSNH